MEKSRKGQIISLTSKEDDLRSTHLSILRTRNHITRLENEIRELEKIKEELLNEGVELHLLEWDIKRIEMGQP